MVIAGKSYLPKDWLIMVLVTGGVVSFLMTGNIKARHSTQSSTYGLLLMAAFLLFDGFTSTFQEKLFKAFKTSKGNQILYVNLCSAAISSFSLLSAQQVGPASGFITRHPEVLWDAIILSGAAVFGQYFIYSQVKEFGALILAVTMNIRQIISIVLSYATNGTAITIGQILSLIGVFIALGWKASKGIELEDIIACRGGLPIFVLFAGLTIFLYAVTMCRLAVPVEDPKQTPGFVGVFEAGEGPPR